MGVLEDKDEIAGIDAALTTDMNDDTLLLNCRDNVPWTLRCVGRLSTYSFSWTCTFMYMGLMFSCEKPTNIYIKFNNSKNTEELAIYSQKPACWMFPVLCRLHLTNITPQKHFAQCNLTPYQTTHLSDIIWERYAPCIPQEIDILVLPLPKHNFNFVVAYE